MSYLVPTDVAARALETSQHQLPAWAADGAVTPDTAPDSTPLWDIEHSEQVRGYRDEGDPR